MELFLLKSSVGLLELQLDRLGLLQKFLDQDVAVLRCLIHSLSQSLLYTGLAFHLTRRWFPISPGFGRDLGQWVGDSAMLLVV